jgi:hypothetical protein
MITFFTSSLLPIGRNILGFLGLSAKFSELGFVSEMKLCPVLKFKENLNRAAYASNWLWFGGSA